MGTAEIKTKFPQRSVEPREEQTMSKASREQASSKATGDNMSDRGRECPPQSMRKRQATAAMLLELTPSGVACHPPVRKAFEAESRFGGP